jgi:uncharacterized protein (TIGR02569 family)
MTAAPPAGVLTAFGVDGDVVAVAGGEGLSFKVADIVLKRVHDADEAAWTQALLLEIEQTGFRIAEPRSTATGGWVQDGWTASAFVAGLRPAAPDWDRIAEAGLRFTDAAEGVRTGGDEILSRRTHRWAVADRVAWHEAEVVLDPEASAIQDAISVLLRDPGADKQLVHADLSGNVFVDPSGGPVILDVSPCLRPRRWGSAIVVADAVLWNGADVRLAVAFASNPVDRDLFGRALLFRMVAEQLGPHAGRGATLTPYRRVLAALD